MKKALGLILVVVVLLGVGVLSLRWWKHELPRLGEMNIVLIVVDTLGAAQVSAYHRNGDWMPHINRLASEGVRFEHAYSTAPWTKPSVGSILTGLRPSEHGVEGLRDAMPDEVQTLSEFLKSAGYFTAAVVSHIQLSPKYGYTQGFKKYRNVNRGKAHVSITSKDVTDRAIGWLNELTKEKDDGKREPFFLFMHYFDPHYLYHHHPEFSRTDDYQGTLEGGMGIRKLRKISPSFSEEDINYLRNLHLEEASFTDAHIGRFIEYLDAQGLRNNTLLIFTADHGEEFMERGWIGHTRSLYNELVRVPLIVSWPEKFAPQIVTDAVSLVDIFPTIADLSPEELPVPAMAGQSLIGLLTSRSEDNRTPRRIFSEVNFTSSSHLKDAHKTSLVVDDYKIIHDVPSDSWELYNLAVDPEERHDLVQQGLGADDKLFKQLADKVRAYERGEFVVSKPGARRQVDITEEEVKELESLGYM